MFKSAILDGVYILSNGRSPELREFEREAPATLNAVLAHGTA